MIGARLPFSTAAVVALLAVATAAQSVSIQFQGGAARVQGWRAPLSPPPGGWASLFVVYAGAGDVPPLAGTYQVENGELAFHPAYPIAPGVHYKAIFHNPGGAEVTAWFDGPAGSHLPQARVLKVYPSSSVLPSNQLRLYIYFSEPMSRGEAARYFHVLDEDGKALEGPTAVFLPGEELWDPRFTRLTMTFDPGRIKRGLMANQSIGPPIAEGKRYTLVIDRDWPDAGGVPLVEGFRKEFRGGPPLRTPPDPKQWRVLAPPGGSRDALVVEFPTPMNYSLLEQMLQVYGAAGLLDGKILTARQEAEWRFTPNAAWKAGDYKLVVDTRLEDLAGNRIGQPFDIDTFRRVTPAISSQTVSVPFSVR